MRYLFQLTIVLVLVLCRGLEIVRAIFDDRSNILLLYPTVPTRLSTKYTELQRAIVVP